MKLLSTVKNTFLTTCIAASAVVSGSVMAAETGSTATVTNLSKLTDSVDFSDVESAIMAIGASLITLYCCYVGARWVLRMVKGA